MTIKTVNGVDYIEYSKVVDLLNSIRHLTKLTCNNCRMAPVEYPTLHTNVEPDCTKCWLGNIVRDLNLIGEDVKND